MPPRSCKSSSSIRIPVLLAMDDVQSLFSASRYKTPQWDMIESYHLSAPLLALDYLTGRKTFVSGSGNKKSA